MQYNIHPIFVHFPIAFLSLYSLIKILPARFFAQNRKSIERTLLFFGILGAFASLNTGEIAEHIVRKNRNIIEIHSLFASLSTFVFVFLGFLEFCSFLNTKSYFNLKFGKFLLFFSKLSERQFLTKTFAILGFILIFLTGVLGGVIVYGTSADPFAKYILDLFNLSI